MNTAAASWRHPEAALAPNRAKTRQRVNVSWKIQDLIFHKSENRTDLELENEPLCEERAAQTFKFPQQRLLIGPFEPEHPFASSHWTVRKIPHGAPEVSSLRRKHRECYGTCLSFDKCV